MNGINFCMYIYFYKGSVSGYSAFVWLEIGSNSEKKCLYVDKFYLLSCTTLCRIWIPMTDPLLWKGRAPDFKYLPWTL